MFFSRRPKVPLEDFCKDFYENSILNPVVGSGKVDVLSSFAETYKNLIVEADRRFSDVDTQKLKSEQIILRFELFALAWMHRFGPDLAVRQSLFTHGYLRENNKIDIWDGMEDYGQQIFRSTLSAQKKMGPYEARYVALSNKMRFDLCTKHLDEARKSGIDVEKDNYANRIARAANRLFTEKVWKDHTTAALLIIPLCDRLGLGSQFQPTGEAIFRLAAMITGHYDGAMQAMSTIKPV